MEQTSPFHNEFFHFKIQFFWEKINPLPFPPKNAFFRQITHSYFIGCDIFDELCLRIDVNQKYAELLPQWKDVAHQLEIDQLMTKWVEVCVRPKEGLARAMLEIYMKDGGKYILTYLFKKNNSNDYQVLFPKVNLYF